VGPVRGRRSDVDPQLAGALISFFVVTRAGLPTGGAPASLRMENVRVLAEYFEEGGSSRMRSAMHPSWYRS